MGAATGSAVCYTTSADAVNKIGDVKVCFKNALQVPKTVSMLGVQKTASGKTSITKFSADPGWRGGVCCALNAHRETGRQWLFGPSVSPAVRWPGWPGGVRRGPTRG